MAILIRDENIINIDIIYEEISAQEVKLSYINDELQINTQVIDQNFHEAIWKIHCQFAELGFNLICNGVSLNVYPSAMQFDMGLAYSGMQYKMGMRDNKIVVLLDTNFDTFIECSKDEQLEFFQKWIISKKKENIKQQMILIDSINPNDEFIFFWGHNSKNKNEITKSCFSQWWPCSFEHEGIIYNSSEQWMMAEKARIFSDKDRLTQILSTNNPKEIKEIGKNIKFFDEDVWNYRKYDVVFEGNLMKFSQNESLKSFLRSTKNKIIVEASPYDNIWGIGMTQNEEGINNLENWKGQNLLGFALMEVRSNLEYN